MFDRINLKDEYITVIADERTIVSWYNREKSKVIEYWFFGNGMNNARVNVFTLTDIARSKASIRHDESYLRSRRNKILDNPVWFYDNETGEALIAHLKKVEALENELKDFIQKKIASQLQSPS